MYPKMIQHIRYDPIIQNLSQSQRPQSFLNGHFDPQWTSLVQHVFDNDFLNISDDELLLSHSDQVVTGKKTLGKLSVVGTVHTLNNVNGFDLNRIVNESFISGLKNVMEGNLTIEGEVFIKGMKWPLYSISISNIPILFAPKIDSYLKVKKFTVL